MTSPMSSPTTSPMTSPSRARLVAVVGMGVAVPEASSPAEVWRLLHGDRDVFSEPGNRFPLADFWSAQPQAQDRTYARRAGYLHELRPHPALHEEEQAGDGPPRDQAVRWLRHSLLQAREDVRLTAAHRCGAYIGAWPGGSQSLVQTMLVTMVSRLAAGDEEGDELRTALREHYRHVVPLEEAAPASVVRAALAGIREPVVESVIVDTACASSLYAVDLGTKALLAGECDVAYCGGFHVLDPTASVMFAKLNGLSKTDRVRAFTDAADGTVFSDGAAIVALKTLDRAIADGDTVHGVLAGFGAAADGRGKSISAPNATGQRRAIQRARSVSGFGADDVGWVIAHGTGTPAGDGVESEVISELAAETGQLCTSNKPVFGHTGWVAGVFSLIHALLALRAESVPAQLHAPGPEDLADVPRLRVLREHHPFPAEPERSRTVGVSGFGFGGTNAHLLVTDRPGGAKLRSQLPGRPQADDLVLVGWSAHLPGDPTAERVGAWLRGQDAAPAARFPEPYPAPGAAEVRLSQRTISAVDPCHLMALQAAGRFVAAHGEMWSGLEESTGVIAAHTGFPGMLAGTALRCYAQDLSRALRRHGDNPVLERAAARVEEVRRRFPACTEDSQAGMMPNVIASRIAARYDLHGPTMSIDAGLDSSLMAIKTAQRYLRTGELDLALVLALNGNGTPENGALFGQDDGRVAEGAFLLALSTASTADRQGWTVLARLTPGSTTRESQAPPEDRSRRQRERSYLAADHVVDLLRAVESGALPCRLSDAAGINILTIGSATLKDEVRNDDDDSPEPGGEWLTNRYTKRYTVLPLPGSSDRTHARTLLARKGVVLLDSPESGAQIRSAVHDADALVLTMTDIAGASGPIDAATLEAGLPDLAGAAPHLTVVCDLGKAELTRCLALHDMLLLVAQRLWPRWEPNSSLTVLMTGMEADAYSHPLLALFTGFVKSLRWEKPGSALLVVATDEAATPELLARAGRESSAGSATPAVVYYFDGERRVETLHPAPFPPPPSLPGFPMDDDSVGLVTGGTGGITECLLTALSRHVRPRLRLLGRTSGVQVPPEVLAATEDEVPELRARLVRQIRATDPGLSLRAVVDRVEEMLKARNVHRVVERLKELFGADRVQYLSCDMRDSAAVDAAVAGVLCRDGRIDFVLHAAGQVGSTVLANKTLETFRRVRDTKVLGHQHLKSALRTAPPAFWCNIGSHSGVAGVPGDPDYAAGNAYLEAAAELLGPTPEITIGFGMWAQAGMGADPVLQEQIARDALFTPISTVEGTAQFLSELSSAAALGGASTYLGRHERARLEKQCPGLVQPGPADPRFSRRRPRWVTHRTPGPSKSASWDMDARDDYLFDHLVHEKPTVPATFMLDIAAQAAQSLVPEAVAVGFRHAEFETFLRPFSRRDPRPLRIRATVLDEDDRAAQPIRVEVGIHSDTLAPDGGVRLGALRHFRTQVLLTRGEPPSPVRVRPPSATGAVATVDPYCVGDGPVRLRGIFRNLSDCLAGSGFAQGTWTPRLAGRPYLRTTTTPPLLTCAALRIAALRPSESGRAPLLVPRSIERLDLYTQGANDRDLLARFGHSVVVSLDDAGTHRACTADGRLLLEISGARALDMAGPAEGTRETRRYP